MKNILLPLAKSVLIALGIIAEALAIYAAFKKKIYGSGLTVMISIKKN